MPDLTFKCPACGGYLVFDPEGGQWKCPYCASAYPESELLQRDRQAHAAAHKEAEYSEGLVYHCPSCGSEILTDETTVATHCYYCHSPVVLQGKLTREHRPEKLLPFTISKEEAVERFLKWTRKKHFVPKGFFSREEVQSAMKGVYFPYFVYDCEVEGNLQGEGRVVRTRTRGDYIETDTDHYHVERGGKIRFQELMRPALSGIQRKVTDGIQPFPLDELKSFSGAYLSGFLAERKNLEKASYQNEIEREVEGYIEPLLSHDNQGPLYTSTSFHCDSRLEHMDSEYVLVPVWVMTYPDPKNPKEPYYYAMNGRTGEVCGKLPIIKSKLFFLGGGITAALLAAGLLICYFLIH